MERIVIITACDDKYSPYCGILITSIFENNNEANIVVNILTDGISEDNRARMHQLEEHYNQEINIVLVDNMLLVHFPLFESAPHINLCTYYRFLIPRLFADEERVLYLDCDMIVRESLSPLWQTDLEGYCFAGVKDCNSMQQSCLRLNYSLEDCYYNAGMGLYNIPLLRKNGFEDIVETFVKEHCDLILCHDQDILNACFHGRFKSLPSKWNMLDVFLNNNYTYTEHDREAFQKYRRNPAIVHYTGPLKPWFKDSIHPFTKEFLYYYKISPWDLDMKYFFPAHKRFVRYFKHCIKQILGKCGLPYGVISR